MLNKRIETSTSSSSIALATFDNNLSPKSGTDQQFITNPYLAEIKEHSSVKTQSLDNRYLYINLRDSANPLRLPIGSIRVQPLRR